MKGHERVNSLERGAQSDRSAIQTIDELHFRARSRKREALARKTQGPKVRTGIRSPSGGPYAFVLNRRVDYAEVLELEQALRDGRMFTAEEIRQLSDGYAKRS